MKDSLFRIIAVAADIFGVPAEQLGGETSPASLPQWDSLAHLNLTLALEQEFGVRFGDEEMESVGCLADWVGLICRGAATN